VEGGYEGGWCGRKVGQVKEFCRRRGGRGTVFYMRSWGQLVVVRRGLDLRSFHFPFLFFL
jgi:hypothetical protein